MKNLIIFVIILAVILITTSLLLDELMGIFIVCIVICFALTIYEKENDRKKLPPN